MLKIAYAIAASNFTHPGIQRRVVTTNSVFQSLGHKVDLFPISSKILTKSFGWFANELPFDVSNYDAVILRSIILGTSTKTSIAETPTFPERHYSLKLGESAKDQVRRYWENWILNPIDYSSGIFYVTSEIARLDGVKKPNLVVGNSALDLKLFGESRQPIKGRIGMSVGSFSNWTGIDLFFQLAKKKSNFRFVIAAPYETRFSIKNPRYLPDNVEFVFNKNYAEYVSEIKTWSYAVGPLALARKGLSEAAPLKVRDYVSLGIPTFINYLDTNLNLCDDSALMQASSENCDWQESFSSWLEVARGLEIEAETKEYINPYRLEKRRINFNCERLNRSSGCP